MKNHQILKHDCNICDITAWQENGCIILRQLQKTFQGQVTIGVSVWQELYHYIGVAIQERTIENETQIQCCSTYAKSDSQIPEST